MFDGKWMMLTQMLIYHVASGQSFFTGVFCLMVAVGLSSIEKTPRRNILRNTMIFLWGILVFVSATPLSPWVYVLGVLLTLFWWAGVAIVERESNRVVRGLGGSVVLFWLIAIVIEASWHLNPRLAWMGHPELGIIADSITAGTDDRKVKTWPRIVADRHLVTIHDHSAAGATVASAIRQARAVSAQERLVLLEIGGNDLLGGTSPAAFEVGLAKLLETVRRPGRVIVMLELPLPPTYHAYGRIQRKLARRYHVSLIPKRVILGVLLRRGATLDSIHLTQDGHERMADAIWKVLRPAFAQRKEN